MTEAATLRKLRSANAKLMKTNLTLLLADRESEVEIEELTKQLQECARQMEARGIAMPPKYALLLHSGSLDLQKVDELSTEQQSQEQDDDVQREKSGNTVVMEESSTPTASSVAESESAFTPAILGPEDRDDSDSSDDDSSSEDDLA